MKKIKMLGLIVASLLFINTNVKAASPQVSASSTSTTAGGSVIITVRANNMAGQFSVTSSNSAVLSGGTSSTWIDNGTQTFTFKANSTGSATVTVTPVDVADYEGNPVSGAKSVTITVGEKKKVVLSSNNNLTDLSIEGASISPEFNKDTLEYSVELEPDTTAINIVATTSDGATVTGAGSREVTDGDNRIEVVVTAENGTTKTYIINAKVKEFNPIEVIVNEKKYTIVRKKSLLKAPNNYEETTVKIKGEDIPAFKSKITKYTLIGLKDTEGNINLFIYNKKNKNYKIYKEYTFNKVILSPIEISKKKYPKNYKKVEITYNEQKIEAYKLNEDSKFALIYGKNIETGKDNMYMYNEEEDTLQIYNTEETKTLTEKLDLYLKVILGSSVLIVVLIFIIIMLLVSTKKRKNKHDTKEEVKNEQLKSIDIGKEN